jgi:hypothetical protein
MKVYTWFFLSSATDYFMIKNGSLYSKTMFDHDTYNPGPQLSAHVECFLHLSPNVLPIVHEKVFNITVLDLNDNGIVVQAANKTVNIVLEQPHFVKVCQKQKKKYYYILIILKTFWESHGSYIFAHPVCWRIINFISFYFLYTFSNLSDCLQNF